MKKSRGQFYTAEWRWATAFGRFFLNFINLEAFYSTTVRSLDSNKTQIEKDWRDGLKKAANDPAYAELKKENPLFVNTDIGEKFANAMGSRSVRLSKQTVDAAALVFAHTLLDVALSDACWISFAAKPQDWYRFTENRKMEIGKLRAQTLDENLKRVASEMIEQLERESMVKRLERIHEICVPQLKDKAQATRWIKFDRLERFDQLRHRIIHDARFTRSINTIENDVYFAKQAGLSVFMLLHQVYKFKLGKGNVNNIRNGLRLFAIIRREFPEIWDLFGQNVDAFLNAKDKQENRTDASSED
jgi:hypothetical protein